ncbi:hypothetical protein EON65_29385 [archaeon]|nr:MAG: hypothetical protein EON65_29385 [archaeon]
MYSKSTVSQMGGIRCIGGEPSAHKMHIILVNQSDYNLHPSTRRCKCPEQHGGFNAIHGKFLKGHLPILLDRHNELTIIVGVRSGSAVCPVGWFEYTTLDNSATVICTYASAGWLSGRNRVYVKATVTGGDLRVIVRQLHPQGPQFTVEILPANVRRGYGEHEAGDMPMDNVISLFADLLIKPVRYRVQEVAAEAEQKSNTLMWNVITDAAGVAENLIGQVSIWP